MSTRACCYVVATSGCSGITRLCGYIRRSIEKGCRGHRWHMGAIADVDSVDDLLAGTDSPCRLLVVAHGMKARLVLRGQPGEHDCELVDDSWWVGERQLGLCLLLGCYSALAVGPYGLCKRCTNVVGYGNVIAFYDGNALGKEITQKMVDAIVDVWGGGRSAADAEDLLRGKFEVLAGLCADSSGSFLRARRRETNRLLRLCIGLHLESLRGDCCD